MDAAKPWSLNPAYSAMIIVQDRSFRPLWFRLTFNKKKEAFFVEVIHYVGGSIVQL